MNNVVKILFRKSKPNFNLQYFFKYFYLQIFFTVSKHYALCKPDHDHLARSCAKTLKPIAKPL